MERYIKITTDEFEKLCEARLALSSILTQFEVDLNGGLEFDKVAVGVLYNMYNGVASDARDAVIDIKVREM